MYYDNFGASLDGPGDLVIADPGCWCMPSRPGLDYAAAASRAFCPRHGRAHGGDRPLAEPVQVEAHAQLWRSEDGLRVHIDEPTERDVFTIEEAAALHDELGRLLDLVTQ